MGQRYAVLFKAFSFGGFVQRQLRRTVAAAPSGDVFLFLDVTRSDPGAVAFERVVRYRESDLVKLGYPEIFATSLFWYNADYPLYYFHQHWPEYDVVVMVEYDAVVNVNLDDIVEEFRRQEFDLLGHGVGKTLESYWWTETMTRFYERAAIRPYLICVSMFSVRAIEHLAATRLRHGEAGVRDAAEWPIGECFVATELASAGFRIGDLSSFGNLNYYDWWPPTHELELRRFPDEAVLHPVLTGSRFVKSLFKSTFRSGVIASAKFVLRQFKPRRTAGARAPIETALARSGPEPLSASIPSRAGGEI